MAESIPPQVKSAGTPLHKAGLVLLMLQFPLNTFKSRSMTSEKEFDVIIVGGSYAGLAAALALGRALKKVLIIDDGQPCNRQTPHSHNFLTNDGKAPAEIAALAKLQVGKYENVRFIDSLAINGKKTGKGFKVEVATGESFGAKKLIFATGIKDVLPDIDGLAACWGISVIHCPYCHGYEVRQEKTGVLGNDDTGFDFTRLIANWTTDLTLFTNGQSKLTGTQTEKLHRHRIQIMENEIERLEHANGYVQNIMFKDGTRTSVHAIYAPVPFVQHCEIPELLGCELTEEGYIKIDGALETTVEGVFAVGDNASRMRTVANAVAMGTAAGIVVSKKMILEAF